MLNELVKYTIQATSYGIIALRPPTQYHRFPDSVYVHRKDEAAD